MELYDYFPTNPSTSTLVYHKKTDSIYCFDGNSWVRFATLDEKIDYLTKFRNIKIQKIINRIKDNE